MNNSKDHKNRENIRYHNICVAQRKGDMPDYTYIKKKSEKLS